MEANTQKRKWSYSEQDYMYSFCDECDDIWNSEVTDFLNNWINVTSFASAINLRIIKITYTHFDEYSFRNGIILGEANAQGRG
jgi:hypothetical protein